VRCESVLMDNTLDVL